MLYLLNKVFLVKITNSNIMLTYVSWIPLAFIFRGSGVVSDIKGKHDAVASE